MAKVKKTSIDKDQNDAQKVKKILEKNKVVAPLYYLFLDKNQKTIYKTLKNKIKNELETKKINFDKNNIFEVENFNF
ncbi:MAG: hypothetical protein K2L48_03125 [Mycoplasmoidaceae bacterium]|nr:hypothetical protein [Mycoplasmoidaceae bacterium]